MRSAGLRSIITSWSLFLGSSYNWIASDANITLDWTWTQMCQPVYETIVDIEGEHIFIKVIYGKDIVFFKHECINSCHLISTWMRNCCIRVIRKYLCVDFFSVSLRFVALVLKQRVYRKGVLPITYKFFLLFSWGDIFTVHYLFKRPFYVVIENIRLLKCQLIFPVLLFVDVFCPKDFPRY